MSKLASQLAILGLVVVMALAVCPYEYQFNTPHLYKSCAESCKNPLYDNCPPSLYIPWPMDQYCGLGQDNVWRNYTYTCEVCNAGSIGYYFGPCRCSEIACPLGQACFGGNCQVVPTCETIQCQEGYQCVDDKCVLIVVPPECTANSGCLSGEICDNGKCRTITCADITCQDPLDTCEYGVCFRKYDYFCSKSQPRVERVYCELNRPSNEGCPWYPPKLAQNPTSQQNSTVCAVSAWNGDLIDFQSTCEACKRTYVDYVYNQPCNSVPVNCKPNSEACVDGWCVAVDPCANVVCWQGEKCNNGICVPVCNCDAGYHCDNNQCVPDHPTDPCAVVTCLEGYYCQNGQCLDKCATIKCSEGYKCQAGQCVPDSNQGSCPFVPCPYGYSCSYGQCVLNPTTPPSNNGYCSTNRDCTAGSVCIGNLCKEMACDADWRCYGSGPCRNGRCVNETPRN